MTASTNIIIDTVDTESVSVVVERDGREVHRETVARSGHVDNGLLTVIDSLFKKNILDKFATISVKAGPGVDRTSILYRLVLTLDAALRRHRAQNS